MADNRSHLEEKYTWDLTTIFDSDQRWETEVNALKIDLEKAQTLAGHLLDSAKDYWK